MKTYKLLFVIFLHLALITGLIIGCTTTPTTSTPEPEPGAPVTANLDTLADESGSVRSNGGYLAAKNAGDTSDDLEAQVFLSFDMSAIPAGVTLTAAEIDYKFGGHDILGDPFGKLGCMLGYADDFGTLDSRDYFGGVPAAALTSSCSESELSSRTSPGFITALQDKIGSNRFQMRIQFATNVAADVTADMIRMSGPRISVTYNKP